MNATHKKIIGLSGVARSGKDTFAEILENKLRSDGKTVKKISLAGPLKQQCDSFFTTYLQISAFTQKTEEKNIIRPFLVCYGDAQRKRTNGRYWIEIAEKEINETKFDYYILTDIRYDHYDRDELYWLKKEMNGVLVHISRYENETKKTAKISAPINFKKFIPPANEHEMINDPKVQKKADYIVEWPTMISQTESLTSNPNMIKYVEDFVNFYKSSSSSKDSSDSSD